MRRARSPFEHPPGRHGGLFKKKKEGREITEDDLKQLEKELRI